MAQKEHVQPGVNDKEHIQPTHHAEIQFTRSEQPPKQEKIERHMRPGEDGIAQLVIVDPVEQGKDAPLATADGVHFVDEDESQPEEEEKVGHNLYFFHPLLDQCNGVGQRKFFSLSPCFFQCGLSAVAQLNVERFVCLRVIAG